MLQKKYSATTIKMLRDYAKSVDTNRKRKTDNALFEEQFRFCSYFRKISYNCYSVAIYKRDADDVWALRVNYRDYDEHIEYAPTLFDSEKKLDRFLANYENMRDCPALESLVNDLADV